MAFGHALISCFVELLVNCHHYQKQERVTFYPTDMCLYQRFDGKRRSITVDAVHDFVGIVSTYLLAIHEDDVIFCGEPFKKANRIVCVVQMTINRSNCIIAAIDIRRKPVGCAQPPIT
mmetsp:Transcript_34478/g.71803  ORF Transcript_34478/g.71803 Transcript_34478/m.71803 type:complete len:118 (-) Transcript_34478:1630-1983(-)